MAHHEEVIVRNTTEFQYERQRRADQMKMQVVTFALMIFLTRIAFIAVNAGFSPYYVTPIILLFAGIQVVLQLYYFMHMNEKNMGLISFFMWSGMFITFITMLCFVTIIWWNTAW